MDSAQEATRTAGYFATNWQTAGWCADFTLMWLDPELREEKQEEQRMFRFTRERADLVKQTDHESELRRRYAEEERDGYEKKYDVFMADTHPRAIEFQESRKEKKPQ
jgi:hypothetical protein